MALNNGKSILKGSEIMPKKRVIVDEPTPKLRPASTEEGRENQLIALAANEVEYRIRNHTASSQELVHFLKLGSTKAKLETEKLRRENELLIAKTEALKSAKHSEELFESAMRAFGIYTGSVSESEEDEDDPLKIL